VVMGRCIARKPRRDQNIVVSTLTRSWRSTTSADIGSFRIFRNRSGSENPGLTPLPAVTVMLSLVTSEDAGPPSDEAQPQVSGHDPQAAVHAGDDQCGGAVGRGPGRRKASGEPAVDRHSRFQGQLLHLPEPGLDVPLTGQARAEHAPQPAPG